MYRIIDLFCTLNRLNKVSLTKLFDVATGES